MNWETFDWGSWWFGVLVTSWTCVGLDMLGEHMRGRK